LIVAPLAAPSLSADANPQVVAMHCQFGSPRASLARNGDAPATTTGLCAADMSTVDQLAFFRNASGAASGIWSSGRLYMLFVKIGIVTGADLTALVAFAKSRAGIT
jgi:hypothetical protein